MIYDIGIIGAGPAGSTFARILAEIRPDLKIILLDGQIKRSTTPCGGLLSPDAQKVLASFDLGLPKSVLVEPQIFSVKTIDLVQNLERDYFRLYLNMDRYEFDQWLISLVPQSVDYVKAKCLKIVQIGSNFELSIKHGSELSKVICKQLVGAEGANSIVRKSFFDNKIDYYLAIQQWFTNPEKKKPIYYCIFDSQTSKACSWLMHKDDHLIYGGAFSPQHSRENFEKQKRRFCKSQNYILGEPIKTEACQVMKPKGWRDFVLGKPGVYLIGEAAGLISASSFEGFSYAFESGLKLAEAFQIGTNADQIFKTYKKKMRVLRFKLLGKMIKRDFLYTAWTRKIIMKSGVQSINKIKL